MSTRLTDFSLPNVSAGPDPFSVATLSEEIEFVVLFFQRDHYCTNCRKQVQAIAEQIDAFHEHNAEARIHIKEVQRLIDLILRPFSLN